MYISDDQSDDQILRNIIATLPKPDQDELYAKAEEIRQVIRSSNYGLMAFVVVKLEIESDPEIVENLEACVRKATGK